MVLVLGGYPPVGTGTTEGLVVTAGFSDISAGEVAFLPRLDFRASARAAEMGNGPITCRIVSLTWFSSDTLTAVRPKLW